jgi:RsbT co-antagonist protein rsbRD N-terminal domain
MKNTEVRPESASVRLAAYLESHKDAMTNEWVGRVRKDSAVPTDFMTKPEIIDHIPQIFDAIIQALRQHRSDTTIEQVHQIAARHTIVRWIEHFNLQAVLRELSLLRAEFIYHLRVFEEEHPDFGIAARLFASTTIHQILDDAVIDTTNTFLKLAERDDRDA